MELDHYVFLVAMAVALAVFILPGYLEKQREVVGKSRKKRGSASSKAELARVAQRNTGIKVGWEIIKVAMLGYLIYLGVWFVSAFKWFVKTLLG